MVEHITVELQVAGVRFFSPCDESAFFGWLDKLPFVERYEGRGPTLYVSINPLAVDEDGLREMLALFRRYGIGLRQLAVFDRRVFRVVSRQTGLLAQRYFWMSNTEVA